MKHHPLLLAVSAAAFVAASTVPTVAPAQAATEADILADQASAIIVGDKIILKRVPVRFGPDLSRTRLRDVTIDLTGRVNNGSIARATIVEEGPATPLAVGFVAGRYKDVANDCEYVVSGPGAGTGGRTNWSISSAETSCTDSNNRPLSGTWQTGPIAGHRNQAQLEERTCPDADPSTAYGVWGGSGDRYGFTRGNLLRVTRAPNSLVMEEVGAGSAVNCLTSGGPITLDLCPGNVCPERTE
ncbi:MAG: hypothetical protein ACT4QA_19585 [Panacagrimonas sp.]